MSDNQTVSAGSLTEERTAQRLGGNMYGVYPAIVTDLDHDKGQPRVELRFPWLGESADDCRVWAWLAATSAGPDAGIFFPPAVGNEVLVAFEAGDMSRPYVVGGLWNGNQSSPWDVESGRATPTTGIVTPSGVTVEIEDDPPRIVIKTPGGRNIMLDDKDDGEVLVEDSNGNEIRMNSEGVKIVSSATVTIDASKADINAGSVFVKAGILDVDGIVNCRIIMSEQTVSGSYTPGAGNVW